MPEEHTESVHELVEKRDALLRLKEAIEKRIGNISKEEQRELDALVERSFNPRGSEVPDALSGSASVAAKTLACGDAVNR
jgi:hypothetical protein